MKIPTTDQLIQQLCDGDHRHPLAQVLTIDFMTKVALEQKEG